MLRSVSSSLVLMAASALLFGVAHAAEVKVAVASNFTAPMRQIVQRFEAETGHRVKLSFGGTGQFYAQIKNGAPYDLLFAADQKIPTKLVQEGVALTETRFTYAQGRLVLWSKNPGYVDDEGSVLRDGSFKQIAIADPKLAPYGAATMQVLGHLGLTSQLEKKIVQGKNIGQAYQFVFSGNASLGFVALSQVYRNGVIQSGSGWIVPTDLYDPIRQDVVLLKSAKANEAAKSLLEFVRTDATKNLIRSFGYGV